MAWAGTIFPGVEVNPDVVHGKPLIAGTRMPVALVLGQLAGGASFEELEREYALTADQVHAALGHGASKALTPSESEQT
jgi:uncharacterized protein (DUF433 family)